MAFKKKEKAPEAGAPAWLVTYGDMVTLLLTFFVLLLSMSEVKQDEKLIDFMEAIREAFGYQGGMQQTPLEDRIQSPRNVPLAQMFVIPIEPADLGEAADEGVDGPRDTVRPIREADRFECGAPVQFQELSSEVTAGEMDSISEIVKHLRGFNTQVEVRGHCSPKPVAGTAFTDHTDLAFARARNVADLLVEAGIDRRRLVIVAAGTNEPLATRAYEQRDRNKNDIVEVLELSLTVSDWQD
ncbi:MAG: OmpA family protein [Phycisphaerae bacterium]|nr:OmpA family protein [Phycisphaerae bacterium]